jgi:hypothetical protein
MMLTPISAGILILVGSFVDEPEPEVDDEASKESRKETVALPKK